MHVVCKPFFGGFQPVFCNGVITYVHISMTVKFSDQRCFTLGNSLFHANVLYLALAFVVSLISGLLPDQSCLFLYCNNR